MKTAKKVEKKKVAKKVASKTEPASTKYEASISILGVTYTAKGDSVVETLQNLNVGTARGKAILTMSRGGKSKIHVLTPILTSRLFNTAGVTREIILKRTAQMFELN